ACPLPTTHMRNPRTQTRAPPAPPATPTPIESHTCHHGGGAVDASRISIAKVLTGGMKLRAVLNAELGLIEIGNHTQNGNDSSSISGMISPCASRMSLTTAPTLTISDPYVR